MSSNSNEILVHVLGILFIVIVFSLAFAYLKPYRLHKTRRVSTLLLKISYLFYMLVLMVAVYLATIPHSAFCSYCGNICTQAETLPAKKGKLQLPFFGN
ncbi:MAG: hypothetical protein MUD02_09910 [Bacteroidales bacterium]|nr:hypothetical protein [Bacteroidales bacterium]